MSRIVVLGAGESGAGAAVLAKVKGFDTFVSDMSAIKDKYKELLDKHGIVWEEGQHTEELILNADEVVKSPGIPNDAPLILKLKEKGIPIISEIEFAGRYTDAKMICITGSNGKTTTTSLIYHIFKSAGLNVGLAGNIGNSLALQVAMEKHDYYVIELSSFQLDNMYKFRANIAVLMNITPDHLDRYDHCMQKYVDAKFRITQNQTPEDAFIYWNDDPIIRRELEKHGLKAHPYPFAAPSPMWKTEKWKSTSLSLSTWNKRNLRYMAPTTCITHWLPVSPPTLPVSKKKISAKPCPISKGWNTALKRWRQCAASSSSTIPRQPTSIPAGMLYKA